MDEDNILYDSDAEIQEALSYMSNELIEDEIDDQIDNTFANKPNNFMELYLDKYSVLKKRFEGQEEALSELEAAKNKVIEDTLTKIEEKFDFTLNRDNITDLDNVTQVLYDFFIINYTANLSVFLEKYIIKNKQLIVNEIKKMKIKSRDVSSISAKNIFSNVNDGLILIHLPFILYDILPNMELNVNDIIVLITRTDDNYIYSRIENIFTDNDEINIDDTFYKAFLNPLLQKEEDYSVVISVLLRNIYDALSVNNNNNNNDINIFKN